MANEHGWRFFRAGGFDQVQLTEGGDVASLEELDPKLWVAIACPARSLELDEHTLALLDTDHDGRIRVPEVLAAAKWITSVLTDPDELFEGKDALPLESIADNDEGKGLRASAKQILKNLGKADAKSISPADTLDTKAIFAKTLFNGDGIVPPESAEDDEATAKAIKDVIACHGAEMDMSGLAGVSQAKVDLFFTEAKAHVDWWGTGEGDQKVLPLGDATAAAWSALEAVRAKVADFFTRTSLAAMDERAGTALNPSAADLAALATQDLSGATSALVSFPIARVEASRALPLTEGLNPSFAGAIEALRKTCVVPLLGERTFLSAGEWAELTSKLAPHGTWLGTKPAGSVEKLGIVRLKELVGGDAKAKIDALIAKDKALEPEAKAIAAVDKLVHYYRDFAKFLANFVSFQDFYGRKDKASFQAGTLYLDGRSFELCLRVSDAAKHAALAGLSMACLAYCDCTRGAEKMSIVAAVTNGDSDFLMVGRNGVFYDRKGRDWDATVTKIVEQPISIRQAFWSPYKKAARFISAQIERFAGEKAAQSDRLVETHAAIPPADSAIPAAPPAPAPGAPAARAPFDVGKFAGIFAAIGLAVGSIGTAIAAMVTGLLDLRWWQMPLAIVGLLLVISGPSMLLAALKLRQRNLGPLLDAGGWAINARARINIPFGAALTKLAALPPGSSRQLTDPFAEKKRPWKTWLVILVVVSGGLYLARNEIKNWLRPHVQSVPIVREWVAEEATAAPPAPAAAPPASADAPAED